MRRQLFAIAWVMSAAMLSGLRASAQDQKTPTAVGQASELPTLTPGVQQLLRRLWTEAQLNRFLRELRHDFSQMDADADGKLTPADIVLHDKMETRSVRPGAVQLEFDLDGDGFATEDEIRTGLRYRSRGGLHEPFVAETLKRIAAQVQAVMQFDKDKDGRVSLAEGSPLLTRSVKVAPRITQTSRVKQAMTLQEGTVELSMASYLANGEALFRHIDSDNDGSLSQQEVVAYWRRPTGPDQFARERALPTVLERTQPKVGELFVADSRPRKGAGCGMPNPSANAKVLVFSGYGASALSNVTIGTQDAVVRTGQIVVEPGDDPLYLVIGSTQGVIWQFTGAVDRVEWLVMSNSAGAPGDLNQPPRVGATGIPEQRVSFFSQRECLSALGRDPDRLIGATQAVREAFAREPDKVAAFHSPLVLHIPSGVVTAGRGQGDGFSSQRRVPGSPNAPINVVGRAGASSLRDQFYRNVPGGVVGIDAAAVVASQPVVPYDVLPMEAGLIQLLETGALKQNPNRAFVVQRKTRFPAGLHGAHLARFVVPAGVPMPDGDPGDSCVVSEDFGLKGPSCAQ